MPSCFHNAPPQRSPSSPPGGARSGIVMIEAAMAVLVLAIGIIAVFVLFQGGLKRSEESLTDTHTALFAQSVFDGIKAASLSAANFPSTDANAWTNFWNDFRDDPNPTNVPIPFQMDCWDGPPLYIRPYDLQALAFTNRNLHGSGVSNIVNHALRYQLDALETNIAGNEALMLTLRVWPGEFGPTNEDRASVFYTEIRLPDRW